MLKFYYAPKTCALAVHLALEHIGAPYEAIVLDFSQQAQRSPEYLHINPKGRVPALVTEDGFLSETPALLLYLCQRFPEANLAPLGSIFATAEMQAFNNYLCATVHVAHAHRVRGTRWTSLRTRDAVRFYERMGFTYATNKPGVVDLILRPTR